MRFYYLRRKALLKTREASLFDTVFAILMRSRGKGRGQVSPHLYHMEIYETDWN